MHPAFTQNYSLKYRDRKRIYKKLDRYNIHPATTQKYSNNDKLKYFYAITERR